MLYTGFNIGSNKPSMITENLFLGGEKESSNLAILRNLGIKHILVVGKELKEKFPNEFNYKSISVDDHPYEDIKIYFEDAYNFIKTGIEDGGCLVHCKAGVSRSASMIIAYLMKENLCNFENAYYFVKNKRSIVYPNFGFQRQLKKFEIELGIISEEQYNEEIKFKTALVVES